MQRDACAWLAAAWLCAPAPASALVTVGALPLEESAQQVEVQGTIAWVLSGPADCFLCEETLRAIDFSDPRAPLEIGSVTVPRSIGVELEGTRAYLPGPSLRVVDISDPAAPQVIPVQNYPSASDVDVVGSLAYLARGESFAIHEVSGVYSAPKRGSLEVAASQVLVQDTLAYVTGGRAFRVIDVSDPAKPRVLGQAPVGRFAAVAAVRDGRAYIVESEPDGVRMLDVADPAAPAELAFVVRAGSGLALDGELAYLGGAELTALDLGAPDDPAELGALKASSPIQDFALVDGLCIAATAERGVLVIDLSEPSFPRELGALDEADVVALDVEVRGTRAVVASDGTLDVIDVSDPAAPIRVGRALLPAAALDLERQDDLAFVADAEDTLRVFRIEEDGDPIELSRYRAGGSVIDLELLGGVAYLAVANGRMELVDVSSPTLPRRRSRGVAEVFDLALAGGYAFALDLFDGVRVVDLAKPNLARQRGFLSVLGARAVEVRGRRAFVAGSTARGGFVHAVVPFQPAGAARPVELPLGATPSDVEIARERVYVSAGASSCPDEGSLAVIDAARVVELGARCVPGAAAVDVADGRVYVAAGGAGLRILDFGPEYDADVYEVGLDVQPSRPGFRASLSNKPIEVAVLGASDFDVRGIVELHLGPAQAAPARAPAFADVNGDGLEDLFTAFRLRAAGVRRDDERLCVAGSRLDGTPFEGCDPPAPATPR